MCGAGFDSSDHGGDGDIHAQFTFTLLPSLLRTTHTLPLLKHDVCVRVCESVVETVEMYQRVPRTHTTICV